MNDQLLNSYYYTPHFSNYVVRGLSFCLLGRGGGRRGEKREEKKGGMVFLLPVPLALFVPLLFRSRGLAPSGGGRRRFGSDVGKEERKVGVKLRPLPFCRAKRVSGGRERPSTLPPACSQLLRVGCGPWEPGGCSSAGWGWGCSPFPNPKGFPSPWTRHSCRWIPSPSPAASPRCSCAEPGGDTRMRGAFTGGDPANVLRFARGDPELYS